MIRKASKAAFALSSMLSPSTSATLLNKLFAQLIEPILLYAVEQWIPYIHPRKMDKLGPTTTFVSTTSQLNMEDVWKRMVYTHYQLSITTPAIAVRSELGSTPTYIPGIARLAKYLSYINGPEAPPPPSCCQSSHGSKSHQLLLQVRLVEQLLETPGRSPYHSGQHRLCQP